MLGRLNGPRQICGGRRAMQRDSAKTYVINGEGKPVIETVEEFGREIGHGRWHNEHDYKANDAIGGVDRGYYDLGRLLQLGLGE